MFVLFQYLKILFAFAFLRSRFAHIWVHYVQLNNGGEIRFCSSDESSLAWAIVKSKQALQLIPLSSIKFLL